jgi:hypothetical protein
MTNDRRRRLPVGFDGGVALNWQSALLRRHAEPGRHSKLNRGSATRLWRADTVYFDDAESVSAHLPIVDTYGLRGAVFWCRGAEDPSVWTAGRC